jgi:hypothetical protein
VNLNIGGLLLRPVYRAGAFGCERG